MEPLRRRDQARFTLAFPMHMLKWRERVDTAVLRLVLECLRG
jgi:hypothetical protein